MEDVVEEKEMTEGLMEKVFDEVDVGVSGRRIEEESNTGVLVKFLFCGGTSFESFEMIDRTVFCEVLRRL